MINSIEDVKNFVKIKHAGQFRKYSNVPYHEHCFDVYNMLVDCGFTDEYMLYAALLHDIIEDTNTTFAELREFGFNYEVLKYIDVLTLDKHNKNPFYKSRYITECLRYRDTLCIKVADRLCNTLDFLKANNYKYAKIYFHQADILFYFLSLEENTCMKNLYNKVMIVYNNFHKRK